MANRLKILGLLTLVCFVACSSTTDNKRYHDEYIETETVITEVNSPATEIEGVAVMSGNGQILFQRRAGTLPKKDAVVWSGGGSVVKNFRVIWRTGSGWDDVPVGDLRRTDQYYREDVPIANRGRLNWSDGVVAGDYVIPVERRIPNAVIEALKHDPNGTLRIKLKIYPNTKASANGVSLGWDVRRPPKPGSTEPVFELSGGDFK